MIKASRTIWDWHRGHSSPETPRLRINKLAQGSLRGRTARWSGTDAVAVGLNGTVMRRAANGTWSTENADTSEHLRGIDASGAALVAVGDNDTVTSWQAGSWFNWNFSAGTALHYTGITCYASAWGCWMSAHPVSGSGGTMVRLDDGSRANVNPTSTYHDVWHFWNGASLLAWGVGESGAYAEFSVNWSSGTPFTSATLQGIWGDALLNRFAVGSLGTVYHSTGSWAVETTPTTADLYAVSGAGGIVYAVGASGTLLRRTGGVWTEETAFTNENLYGVSASGSLVFAVGRNGIILRRP